MQDALEGETTAQQAFGKKVDRAVAQRDAQITAVIALLPSSVQRKLFFSIFLRPWDSDARCVFFS